MTSTKVVFLVVAVCLLQIINMAFSKSEFGMDKCFPENNKTWTCNYIPQSIPPGYFKVRIVNFRNGESAVVLNSSTFSDTSWTNVEYLEMKDDLTVSLLYSHFESNCFSGMNKLQELKIDVERCSFDSDDTLAGISTLTILDLSGSIRLPFNNIYSQLTKSGNLPQLQKLLMRGIGTSVSFETRFNLSFFHFLGLRNITHLDIGGMKISDLNYSALVTEIPTLKLVNLSYSHIEETTGNITYLENINPIQSMDFSHVHFPSYLFNLLPGKMVVSNIDMELPSKTYRMAKTIFTTIVMNISGVAKQVNTDTTLWFHNITLVIPEEVQSSLLAKHQNFKTRSLVCRENGIRYADIQVIWRGGSFDSLTSFDLSANGLEMLHPSILSMAPNLEIVDLSVNEIGMMFSNLVEVSSRLFRNIVHLRLINLSDNKIRFVPEDLFAHNSKLEIIDLSNNRLEQIYFSLRNVQNLRVLNVSHNDIHTLDEISLNHLNNIHCGIETCQRVSEGETTVDLYSNPLACSTCKSKRFIEWMVKKKSIKITPQYLFCKNENEMLVPIDERALKSIQYICRLPIVITASSLSAAIVIFIVIISVILIYRHKKRQKRKMNRLNVIERMHAGEGQFEFAVFVSFSSNDFDIVSENVLKPLNANLQLITGVERNLVCTGDLGFRAGFPLHDEVIRCLQKSSVFLAVVSEYFFGSDFCQHEFDQAIVLQKPVLLIIKDEIEEINMSPAMHDLFKRNTRILLSEENGRYVVQPTWEDICVAILDKIEHVT